MARRQIILFLLIVCLPLAMLAWLGSRLARSEQRTARQRLADMATERLGDVDRLIAEHFRRRERDLLEATQLNDYDPQRLRQIVRNRPGIGQLFVVAPDGKLLHPDPTGALNASEREFLLHARQAFDDKVFIRNRNTEEDALPATYAWHVQYWGPGLNLVFHHRLPSGYVVGVHVPRTRWIADLIAELPDTAPAAGSRAGSSSETRIRLVDSNGKAVYQWGSFEPAETAEPLAATALSSPLASWRLEYYADQRELAALGRSVYWNLFSSLAVIALGLIAVACYFYRDYARQMREATQRVNFVNQVSHELKTPLTNIRMYAELLEADLELIDSDEAAASQNHLQVIVAESQRLSRLIGNVLTFSRQQRNQTTLHRTTARVDEVVGAVIERFLPTLKEKGIEVVFDGAAESRVKLDTDALEQILGNLLSNVEKYAADGGRVDIVSRQDELQTTIVVADRGPGIPPSLYEKVFLPFYRLSDRIDGATGTGIGLSIARKLARLHGGDLSLVPSGSGARFQVTMNTPRAESEGVA